MTHMTTENDDVVQVEAMTSGSILFGAFDGRWVQMFLSPTEARAVAALLVAAAEESS